MKKHVKKVAVVTAMCGAMLMSSCTKREMLTPVEPPTEATQEAPTDAPGIYIETSDGVVHNTGLRATASETREWTSPDGSIRVTGLGRYDLGNVQERGIPVGFHVKEGFGLSRFAYRFAGEAPELDSEAKKAKDRVWKDVYKAGIGVSGDPTEEITFVIENSNADRKINGDKVRFSEGTRAIILHPDVLAKAKPQGYKVDVFAELTSDSYWYYNGQQYAAPSEFSPGPKGLFEVGYPQTLRYKFVVRPADAGIPTEKEFYTEEPMEGWSPYFEGDGIQLGGPYKNVVVKEDVTYKRTALHSPRNVNDIDPIGVVLTQPRGETNGGFSFEIFDPGEAGGPVEGGVGRDYGQPTKQKAEAMGLNVLVRDLDRFRAQGIKVQDIYFKSYLRGGVDSGIKSINGLVHPGM